MDSTLTRDYTVLRLDEMEAAFGGLLVRVRASLGLSSFGLQVADIPPNSGDAYPEHDHEYDGQEELYLLLRGSADCTFPAAWWRWTRRPSYESVRAHAVASEAARTARAC